MPLAAKKTICLGCGFLGVLIVFLPCSVLLPHILPKRTLHEQELIVSSTDGPRCELLILSPIHKTNSRRQARFVDNLRKLTYDHSDICVVVLSDDASFSMINRSMMVLAQGHFAFIRILKEPEFLQQLNSIQPHYGDRHDSGFQRHRRSTIAQARNYLLYSATALVHAPKWVLWLDSDLLSYPSDLIQRMVATGKQILVPTCLCAGVGRSSCGDQVYDKNSWAETEISRNNLRKMPPDALRVEGYGNDIGRLDMGDLRTRAKDGATLVELQGIGGTCILIKAALHRRGIFFPPFVVNHELETEGLAQIALRMGIKSYGMLDLVIRHA